MSMPNIPNITPIIDIDREEAITMLLASIALEEMGLAHIINAESEKIQYVLSAKLPTPCSVNELKEVNQGVERVIREIKKLQMLLHDKLEHVISLTPKPPNPPDSCCQCQHQTCCPSLPPKCKHKPQCVLAGCGEGCVTNCADFFHCGSAAIESSMCPTFKNANAFSVKYTLCKEQECDVVSAVLLAVPKTIKTRCLNYTPCPMEHNPNILRVRGRGIMAFKGMAHILTQCTVRFTLMVWDYGCNKDFQMVTSARSLEFNHDSGIVSVAAGNLAIRSIVH